MAHHHRLLVMDLSNKGRGPAQHGPNVMNSVGSLFHRRVSPREHCLPNQAEELLNFKSFEVCPKKSPTLKDIPIIREKINLKITKCRVVLTFSLIRL